MPRELNRSLRSRQDVRRPLVRLVGSVAFELSRIINRWQTREKQIVTVGEGVKSYTPFVRGKTNSLPK